MNILTILGSPRKKGNTAGALEMVEQELSDRHQVDRLVITSVTVNGCLGCEACRKVADRPGCVQKDDAVAVFERMVPETGRGHQRRVKTIVLLNHTMTPTDVMGNSLCGAIFPVFFNDSAVPNQQGQILTDHLGFENLLKRAVGHPVPVKGWMPNRLDATHVQYWAASPPSTNRCPSRRKSPTD